MGDEAVGLDLMTLGEPQEGRRGVGVDEPGRDGDVADPQLLEVQGHGFAVHTDVRDVTARTSQLSRQLERLGHPHRFDGNVCAQPVGQAPDDLHRVFPTVVHGDVGAELLGGFEPAVREVDGDDVARAEQPGAHDGRQADRPGAHDRDHVTGTDLPVENADLVAGGEDVREHEDLLVGHTVGHAIGRGVGKRHAHVLGLGPVDQMAQDPAAAPEALTEATLPTEPARTTRGDARDQHPVPDRHVLHPGTNRLDRADGLVPEDAPVGDRGNVALEDVEVRAADRHGIDSYDGIGVVDDGRLGHLLPRLLTRTVVHECSHCRHPSGSCCPRSP